MAEISANKRIAKNTLMLYFRQILIMGVSLYTVRVVLNTLGAVDYGIYNVVAGVVTMFSFLSGAMATASQRYFSFDLGKKDYEQLKKTFSVSFTIYVLIALVVVLLAETVGLWFVYNKLVIPPERVQAARWIYQASIVSFVFTILTTPYMASIIAHEDMTIYAYVSIVEVILKLGIVFLLPLFSLDKLILYGLLMAVVVIINTTVYRTICRKKYAECRAKLQWDTALFKELLSYTGWNMFGASVGVFKFQAVNIVLNQFFNPVVIAARGIASQVNAAVSSFAQNFSTAVRPQIIKNYAAGKKDEMINFTFQSTRYTFLLMLLIIYPLIMSLEQILTIWLKNYPYYTLIFTRLALIDVLIESLSFSIGSAIQATGKIKKYQIVVGSTLLLNLPISFFSLYVGFKAISVFIIAITLSIFAFIIRLFFFNNTIIITKFNFLTDINFRLIIITLLVLIFSAILLNHFILITRNLVLSILMHIIIVLIIIFVFGTEKLEKIKILNIINGLKK